MALLSIDMIREIQGVADIYAQRERERVSRVNASSDQRAQPAGGDRQRPRPRAQA